MRSSFRSTLIDSIAWCAAMMFVASAKLIAKLRALSSNRKPVAAEGPVEMSLNDPEWGKRGSGGGGGGGRNDGPPDLDEVFRKFRDQLSSVFGKKPNAGGPQNGGGAGGDGPKMPSTAAMGGGVVIAVCLAASVWLLTGFYIVEEGKRGVELRLGEYTNTTMPGLQWRWPYPIQTVEIVNISQVRSVEVGHRGNQKTKVREEALMLTEDQNIVDVQFAVQYTIVSAKDFQFNNYFASRDGEDVVRQVAETAMREVVGNSKMDFVLYEGRGLIASRVKTLMQQILDRYQTGVLISIVNLQNAQPPDKVQGSFDDAVRAKQDRERAKNEGESYANDILPRARGDAARLLEEANGHKQRVIAQAQGDVSRFSQILVEYEKAPQVTRERMYLDMMQQVMQNTSKVVVDTKGGQNLLYLPLDKLIQQSSAGSQGAAASAPVAAPSAPSATIETTAPRRDVRSRETR